MTRKTGTVLVVGAGIGGIRASLDLAEFGYGVVLIDREPHIGGILGQLDHQFPSNRCGMCKMLPMVRRDAASQFCLRKGLFHDNIEISLSTELVSVAGEPGKFEVTLRRKPNFVNPDLCIGCGECEKICPVEVPDRFNEGMTRRKAVYLPTPHLIPNAYTIDPSACTFCGACVGVCPTGAIRIEPGERKAFHVLVVDDELAVRDSLKEWLGEEGFSVEMAASGPEALDLIEKTDFALMLLDIKMPEMDGIEVLKKARQVSPDLSVVMMTAYATVETAVEAMKIGAFDYLVKPFDPEALMGMVNRIYRDFDLSRGRKLQAGALVLCGGVDYFDPSGGKNTLGYGLLPHVVTGRELERILSGTGPSAGKPIRPFDGKPIRKIAWLQCVGSRDLQLAADFCSGICCMYAVKEALLAKEKANGDLEATIFYMDMRTFGKSFQRYRDQAEKEHGIHFRKGRAHTVTPDPESGDPVIRYTDIDGVIHEERYDLVVLSVGQRPTRGADRLAENLGITLNSWGFPETEPFSPSMGSRKGIVFGGSFSGLKDISETVISAGSAALNASRVVHAAGGSLLPETAAPRPWPDVSREPPRIFAAVCTCGEDRSDMDGFETLKTRLATDPAVAGSVFIPRICTAEGWESLARHVERSKPNRLLIGACLPYAYARKLRELGAHVNLDPSLMEVLDIHAAEKTSSERRASLLGEGIARLKRIDLEPVTEVEVRQRALVIGGGIAGMSAALAIADHGYETELVERTETLGGNLVRIQYTLDGHPVKPLLEESLKRIENHPLIKVHLESEIIESSGSVGNFRTDIRTREGNSVSLDHGVTILATGGKEAETSSYGFGGSESVVTHEILAERLENGGIDPSRLDTVVMIQCVDSREEPRNYCSRVCCASAIKHALKLKEANPEIRIYVLYRDIMTYGFSETYYTRAREAGVIFIPYEIGRKPVVTPAGDDSGSFLRVEVFEPILGSPLEIRSDLVVLAPGLVPTLPEALASAFGADLDTDGFFEEAEPKWRPVDSIREGVFACGLAHSPRSIPESIASAEAAAARALRLLWKNRISSDKVVAHVRHSICSLCERCIDACPYGARKVDPELRQVTLNPLMCQGCGACAAVCPNGASIVEGFRREQMFEIIDVAVN